MLAAHVMDQRAAAALAFGHHDLDTDAVEQPDGCLVDARLEYRLGAAGEDGDTATLLPLCGMGARSGDIRLSRDGSLGASSSIAAIGLRPGSALNSGAKGRPMRAAWSDARKRPG
jgi:hypothetical protein